MKRGALSLVVMGALAVGFWAATPSAQAGDPGRKLGRGFANVLFGITEIPQTIGDVAREQGGGAAATWGVMKGIGRFVEREAVGVYEIVTFPLPFPRGYNPIMEPEFPLSTDKGDY